MFNLKTNTDLNICYKNIERIEVIFLFPDGENYVIYCKENKISFSLDSANYDLSKYINENDIQVLDLINKIQFIEWICIYFFSLSKNL